MNGLDGWRWGGEGRRWKILYGDKGRKGEDDNNDGTVNMMGRRWLGWMMGNLDVDTVVPFVLRGFHW